MEGKMFAWKRHKLSFSPALGEWLVDDTDDKGKKYRMYLLPGHRCLVEYNNRGLLVPAVLFRPAIGTDLYLTGCPVGTTLEDARYIWLADNYPCEDDTLPPLGGLD